MRYSIWLSLLEVLIKKAFGVFTFPFILIGTSPLYEQGSIAAKGRMKYSAHRNQLQFCYNNKETETN